MFQGTEEENVRRIVNVGNPTKEDMMQFKQPLLFSGSGYSAVPRQEFQKVLPALPAAPKGNNHRENYNTRVWGWGEEKERMNLRFS